MSDNSNNKVLDFFKKTNAMLEGHFLLSSGLHSDKYMQCALLLQYPDVATELGKMIAGKFSGQNITCVLGPAMGGIVIAYKVAEALGVRSIFGERENGKMCFRRGFGLDKGEKVLVVEDVITTGKSVKELLDIINTMDVNVAGVASIVDRTSGNADFGCDFKSLLEINITTYNPEECPLCKNGVPVVKPGSRGIN